ncbi:hypothetical protein CBM2623_B70253 [Cupriavidus taiwanensis]|nr:hypothetical protein CBM2608_B60251 [Cupriavidus taiwanensis]SPA35735.1 hypothetical protein CBM2623_B70253 [Cupriavidus taiwanensis]SPA52864.1 hypothetical protein CBM2629_B70071 [Cupriavidus taiwanensis]
MGRDARAGRRPGCLFRPGRGPRCRRQGGAGPRTRLSRRGEPPRVPQASVEIHIYELVDMDEYTA